MSQITKVDATHWVGIERRGYTPKFSITENATENYPSGATLKEEPLQPANKRVDLQYNESRGETIAHWFDTYAAGGHKDYLDMRVDSVYKRGKILYFSLFLALVWLLVKFWLYVNGHNNPITSQHDLLVLGTLAIIAIADLFRPIATPVRFHQKNQQVYVWHKKVLYRIPWDECEISVIVAESKKFYANNVEKGYELVLWLNPSHAVNKDLTGQKYRRLILVSDTDSHVAPYGYWEYVRRYMTGDTPSGYEVSEEPRVPSFSSKSVKQKGLIKSLLAYVFGIPLLLLVKPVYFALWFAPFQSKWPKDVHQWSGEECNWH